MDDVVGTGVEAVNELLGRKQYGFFQRMWYSVAGEPDSPWMLGWDAFSILQRVIAGFLVAFVTLYCIYVAYCYNLWKVRFAHKHTRFDPSCISNKRRPVAGVPLVLQDDGVIAEDNTFVKAEHLAPKKRLRRGTSRGTIIKSSITGEKNKLANENAEALDMDHIFVPFLPYLWVMTFVYPNLVFNFIRGYTWLRIRVTAVRRGWYTPPKVDHDKMLCRAILNTYLAVYYTGQAEDPDTGHMVGFFVVENMCYWDDSPQFKMEPMITKLDLTDQTAISTQIGNEWLSPKDGYLMWNLLAMTGHVLSHSMASWGCNMNAPDPFIARMAAVSMVYNNFGWFGSAEIIENCRHAFAFPWLPKTFSMERALKWCFQIHLDNGVRRHPQIVELAKWSKYIEFVVKVRSYFMQQFEEHRADFPGVDGEAFFIGTIMHSLDHCNLEQINTHEPNFSVLHLCTSGKYRTIEEFTRITASGVMNTLPGVFFNYRFKDAPHPFYQKVYKYAAMQNKVFADRMDACVIK